MNSLAASRSARRPQNAVSMIAHGLPSHYSPACGIIDAGQQGNSFHVTRFQLVHFLRSPTNGGTVKIQHFCECKWPALVRPKLLYRKVPFAHHETLREREFAVPS